MIDHTNDSRVFVVFKGQMGTGGPTDKELIYWNWPFVEFKPNHSSSDISRLAKTKATQHVLGKPHHGVRKAQCLSSRKGCGIKVGLLANRHHAVALSFAPIVTGTNHTHVSSSNSLGLRHGRLRAVCALTHLVAVWNTERLAACVVSRGRTHGWSVSGTYLSQMATSFLFHRKRAWRSWFSKTSWLTRRGHPHQNRN